VGKPADESRQINDVKRASDTDGVLFQTHIGGQALLEGIMMRGRYNWAIAVRRPDGGIYTEEHDLTSGQKKNSWMYWPVIRGCTALIESMALGYRSLEIATENAFHDEVMEQPDEDRFDSQASTISTTDVQTETAVHSTKKENEESIPKFFITVGMTFGLLLGVAIFIILPAFLTNLIVGAYGQKTLVWNLVDGVVRIAIFILYIFLISRLQEIRRMFGYHGAEHRTIHCHEHGLELTVSNADLFPSLHVRCGTAFMLMTMLIAIIVFTLVPISALIAALGVTNRVVTLLIVVISRILLIPLVAGLSYEITVKWAGSRPDNPFVRLVLWPGMQLQRLTTKKPDQGQLECAIAAMRLVLDRELLESKRADQ
jgi:uncharacterized protein YqhQ